MEGNNGKQCRKFYLQVKVSKKAKRELVELSETINRPVGDIIRGALYFGLPMLKHILDMEKKLTGLFQKAVNPGEFKKGRPFKEMFDKFR